MSLIRLLKNDLARESATWVEEGIISESQAEQICGHYGIDYHRANLHSTGYGLLLGLGYLFIGLALITLIGANWDEIPRAVRMGGLIALTMATHGVAIYRFRLGDRRGAIGGFFLGNLFFGASIILIAQIYHLGEHMPDGVFWWALGWLPMAALLRSATLAIPMLFLALLWFFMEAGMNFYPALMPLFLICGLWVLARQESNLSLLLLVVGSWGLWIEYSLGFWWSDFYRMSFFPEHIPVSGALLLLIYAIGAALCARPEHNCRDYGVTLDLWAVRGAVLCLFLMSYRESWSGLIEGQWEHLTSMFILLTVLLSVAGYLAWKAARIREVMSAALLLLFLLGGVLWAKDPALALYFQIVANLVLVAFGTGLIVQGIRLGLSQYFFLGVAAVLVTAMMRYFDLVGDYIGGAALFMVFALLLLGAAHFWKVSQSREVKR